MKELLLRNLLILYLGVSLRFLFYKIIKRRDVDFQRLLHGIKCPKNKNDEIFNYKNDFSNRLYAIIFIISIVIIIGLIQKYKN